MRVIGLMSGTSIDGIDAALVKVSGAATDLSVQLVAGATYPYPAELREQILTICGGAAIAIADLAALDDAIAHCFAQAAQSIQQGHDRADLIGSHGQTVYHRPPSPQPPSGQELGYSLQLGRGTTIAHLTHISTVSNFRAADIAAGGQGAPLVSAVDVALLSHPTYRRCVQNIGGIGNVTYLPAHLPNKRLSPASPHRSVLGWDTGPGNMLIDLAVQQLSDGQQRYDKDGAWAATGTPDAAIVDRWLQQDFFQQPPPKSTGRELFGRSYLEQCWRDCPAVPAADFLATLTDFTAATIAHSYQTYLPALPDQVLLCGGGSKNAYLKQRLHDRLRTISVLTTDDVGLTADFKEAIAFAVLAYWRHQGICGNLPAVTGAQAAVLLGDYAVGQFSA